MLSRKQSKNIKAILGYIIFPFDDFIYVNLPVLIDTILNREEQMMDVVKKNQTFRIIQKGSSKVIVRILS